jgi:hypothetical protein
LRVLAVLEDLRVHQLEVDSRHCLGEVARPKEADAGVSWSGEEGSDMPGRSDLGQRSVESTLER